MRTFKKYYNMLIKKGKYVTMKRLFSTLSLFFVNVGHEKVNVYEMTYGGLKEVPIVTLYKDYMTLHYYPYYNDPLYWKLSSFLKIKFKNIYGCQLVIFSDESQSIFFKGMKITYNGKPILPHPKKYTGKEIAGVKLYREKHNALQRLNYHRKKARERFQAAAEYKPQRYGSRSLVNVDVSQLPMDDVFKLQNVSQRQYLIDYYGLDAILAGLEANIIHKDVINGNPYELVTVKIPFSQSNSDEEEEIGTYLRMVNPSTDEIHFEGVPNYNREMVRNKDEWDGDETISSPTVRSALAWRDGETRYTVPRMLT